MQANTLTPKRLFEQQVRYVIAVLTPRSNPATGATGSCRTNGACSWRPCCVPVPTSSSAPSPTASPLDNRSDGIFELSISYINCRSLPVPSSGTLQP
jgi:hypothetical protein